MTTAVSQTDRHTGIGVEVFNEDLDLPQFERRHLFYWGQVL